MDVQNEARLLIGTTRVSDPAAAREPRVYPDALPTFEPVRAADRLAVDEHELDLGVRNAERLDPVLDRRRAVELVRECDLAPLGREEAVELAEEAELGAATLRGDFSHRPAVR